MNLFYNFSDIVSLSYFNWVDFNTFTYFEQLITTFSFNILFYLFLAIFLSIVYKTICRVLNMIF